MQFHKLTALVTFIFAGALLVGCQNNAPTPKETPALPTAAVTATPEPPQATPTATAVPTRSMVVCLPDEPKSLYVYGSNSRSMWSVLEAIYDGPFDTRQYSVQPVILDKLPSLKDGGASLKPVNVNAGDTIVDVDGNLVSLAAGVKVLPSGCSSMDCVATWDGVSALTMDQLVVDFKLLPGLKWSDGTPLTAADSVFSYQLASDPATPTSKRLSDRTFSYQALDDQTVEWTGMPGYYEQQYDTLFWLPLPKHTLGQLGAAQLLTDPTANQAPMGWGPYVIKEWTAGDHITLTKNPNYFRVSEGLPKFDTLVYRFVGNTSDGNLNALLTGECDIVDQNGEFLKMFPSLLEDEKQNKLKTYVAQGPEWEHLDFGVQPASYDNGYNTSDQDRPDLFGDARTRQAFAYCIDRASINTNLLYGRSSVSNSYLPANHPLYQADLPGYAFNPDQGKQLLDEVGWKDSDQDPATPRVSAGVQGVPDGTPLTVNYLTTDADLRKQVAQSIAASLGSCGVQVNVTADSPSNIFGPGPDGSVFGRKFDLVQFAWEAGAQPNCQLYTSAEVPTADNHWIGVNVSGFRNTDYDKACLAASWARPTDPNAATLEATAQQQYAANLPSIPLYSDLKITIARPDLCGFDLDGTARSIFWNLESLDFGDTCKK